MGKLRILTADGGEREHELAGPVELEELDHDLLVFHGRDRRIIVNRSLLIQLEFEPTEPERAQAHFEEFVRNEFAHMKGRLNRIEEDRGVGADDAEPDSEMHPGREVRVEQHFNVKSRRRWSLRRRPRTVSW